MELDGERVAILAANEFEDIEMEYPLLALSDAGAEVVLVPVRAGLHPRPATGETGAKPVTGRFGTPMPPEVIHDHYTVADLDELAPDDLDCLLLPGGFSPDHLRTEEEVVQFVQDCGDVGAIVAAICHGPQLLVETDLLEDRRVTGVGPVRTDLANAGGEVVDEDAVVDGRLVTGRNPDALPAFCRAVGEALTERRAAIAAD